MGSTLTLNEGITVVYENEYTNKSLTAVDFSKASIIAICDHAFQNNNIQELIIPNSVIQIGTHAFMSNANLTSLTLGNRVQIIKDHAFNGAKLNAITIPSSVRSIAWGAFLRNPLDTIAFEGDVHWLGDTSFTKTKSHDSDVKTVILPKSLYTRLSLLPSNAAEPNLARVFGINGVRTKADGSRRPLIIYKDLAGVQLN